MRMEQKTFSYQQHKENSFLGPKNTSTDYCAFRNSSSTISHPQIAHRIMSDILTFYTFFSQPVPGPTISLGILAPTLLTS